MKTRNKIFKIYLRIQIQKHETEMIFYYFKTVL